MTDPTASRPILELIYQTQASMSQAQIDTNKLLGELSRQMHEQQITQAVFDEKLLNILENYNNISTRVLELEHTVAANTSTRLSIPAMVGAVTAAAGSTWLVAKEVFQ